MHLSRVLGVAVATTLLVAASVFVASFPFVNPIATEVRVEALVTLAGVAVAVPLALAAASRGHPRSTPYW